MAQNYLKNKRYILKSMRNAFRNLMQILIPCILYDLIRNLQFMYMNNNEQKHLW